GHLLEIRPDHGLIWHYTSGNWSAFSKTEQPLLSLSMISSHAGWAVGYSGTLLRYDGKSWRSESSPTHTVLRAITALSEKDVWAVGFGSLILHYNGTSWQQLFSPVKADLRSIFMLSSNDGWIVGDDGVILHYHDSAWQRVTSPTAEKLNRVTMLSANEGWAVGANGTILHYHAGIWDAVGFVNDDGVIDSRSATTNGGPAFYGIAMTSPGSGWIIGGASLLSYNREVWSSSQNTIQPPSSQEPVLYSLAMFSGHEGWAIGQVGNAILILHYLSKAWFIYA
ncbi:MAG TPA: hypothetical protein VFN35_16055, partial [Ktedonobacteraceae bacterium]|nr:hypothetical protein [Ktedonobacteraceae bacterium]